ncbi:MAG: hypothetical protein E6Q83_15195 [Thiothrix sp.]|nr:MAG: hypothetical protein E6Q83_15195 [Thiothrix sp.]
MNKTVHQIVLHILRPLIRILHRKGLAFGEFSLLARKVYVEIAEEALMQAEEKPTSSRIAISTGLTRKEVAQLRQHDAETLVDVARYNRSVRVIGGWINDPDFNTPTGQPAVLALQGSIPSFETLVGRYSGDMPARAMLRELLQTGIVSQTSEDRVQLLTNAYIPEGSETEKLAILATDVALLVNTINHNLLCEAEERHFQRKVSYDNLPAEALPQFKHMVNEDAMALLLKLNAWLAQQDRDHNPAATGSGRMRAGLGIYYFEEPVQISSAQQDKQDEA